MGQQLFASSTALSTTTRKKIKNIEVENDPRWTPPPEWKFSLFFNPSTQGGSAHVLRSTFHVSRPSLRVLWLTGQLRRQKLLAQENLFHFFEKITLFFSTSRGGFQTQKWKFPFFLWTLPLETDFLLKWTFPPTVEFFFEIFPYLLLHLKHHSINAGLFSIR